MLKHKKSDDIVRAVPVSIANTYRRIHKINNIEMYLAMLELLDRNFIYKTMNKHEYYINFKLLNDDSN